MKARHDTPRRLNELAESIFSGLSVYGRSPVGTGNHRIRVIGPSDLINGSIAIAQVPEMPVASLEKIAAYRVKCGDLLLNIRGTSFKAAVCGPECTDRFIAGGNLAVIRLKPNTPIGPYGLLSVLESPMGQAALRLRSQGSSTLALSTKALEELELTLPSLSQAEALNALCREFHTIRQQALTSLEMREKVVSELMGRLLHAS